MYLWAKKGYYVNQLRMGDLAEDTIEVMYHVAYYKTWAVVRCNSLLPEDK